MFTCVGQQTDHSTCVSITALIILLSLEHQSFIILIILIGHPLRDKDLLNMNMMFLLVHGYKISHNR